MEIHMAGKGKPGPRKGCKGRSSGKKKTDLLRTARLWESGWTHQRIADALGLSRSSITKDIGKIVEDWIRQKNESVERHIVADLATLREMQQEYLDQWERSKEIDQDGLGRVEYIQGAERCIEKRAKILRYYSDEEKPLRKVEVMMDMKLKKTEKSA